MQQLFANNVFEQPRWGVGYYVWKCGRRGSSCRCRVKEAASNSHWAYKHRLSKHISRAVPLHYYRLLRHTPRKMSLEIGICDEIADLADRNTARRSSEFFLHSCYRLSQ